MKQLFENVTKMALEEIVLDYAQEAKFGYLLTNEAFSEMIEHLNEFFMASRAMKARGDQVLAGAATTAPKPQKRPLSR